MGLLNWMWVEFMATFKPEPYIHECQNYRFAFGLPMRWHNNYALIKWEEEKKQHAEKKIRGDKNVHKKRL